MPDDPLHQPHDKLFKSGFGDPVNAAGFLSGQLPEKLSRHISWERLRLEHGTFVDSQFRRSESDLLFSAPLCGGECRIYLLFEHQFVFDRWIGLRLLRYMARIWEEFLRNHPKTECLPVIIPVVLAQNAQRWELSPQFSSLVNILPEAEQEMRSFVPKFIFRLIQLAEMPFGKIAGTPSGILVLRTLKAAQLEKLLGEEVWDESLIAQVPLDLFERVLRYILAAKIDKKAFANRVNQLSRTEFKETAMTLEQQFRQEGRVLAQQAAVIEALEIRFTQLSEEMREKITQITDSARLHDLFREAIRCDDLEVFGDQL